MREKTLVFRPKRRVGPAEGIGMLLLQSGASVVHELLVALARDRNDFFSAARRFRGLLSILNPG